MPAILKILIPTDFTVQAAFAYRMAKKLEEKINVEIHFLNILAVPDTVTLDPDGNIRTCGEIDLEHIQQQKETAEEKLQHLHTLYGDHIHTHFILGKATDAILQFAENGGFGLVVMGTSGARGLKEKLSGTTAQMVARRSRVPVLSLMCDRSDLVIQNILLVHDFSHPSKENISVLHILAKAFEVKLHLLQVVPDHEKEEGKGIAEANMHAFAALNNLQNYECHLLGDKEVEIGVLHFNQAHAMDIICIGTHGRGGFFHQSITEKLIKHLSKPILSFHLN